MFIKRWAPTRARDILRKQGVRTCASRDTASASSSSRSRLTSRILLVGHDIVCKQLCVFVFLGIDEGEGRRREVMRVCEGGSNTSYTS